MFEPAGAILSTYINHAHNDWIELYLEAGWPALIVLAGFLVWFVKAATTAWLTRSANSAIDRGLACAASISILVMLLHSLVDYPLRTTALSSLFALCCALLIAPVPQREFNIEGVSAPFRWLRDLMPGRRRSRSAAWSGRRYG